MFVYVFPDAPNAQVTRKKWWGGEGGGAFLSSRRMYPTAAAALPSVRRGVLAQMESTTRFPSSALVPFLVGRVPTLK